MMHDFFFFHIRFEIIIQGITKYDTMIFDKEDILFTTIDQYQYMR